LHECWLAGVKIIYCSYCQEMKASTHAQSSRTLGLDMVALNILHHCTIAIIGLYKNTQFIKGFIQVIIALECINNIDYY